MKKILALALAVGVSGCATAHNGYYNGGWNKHYSGVPQVSDKTALTVVGIIAAGALVERSIRNNRESEIVVINGVRYREYYKVHSPCPIDHRSQCKLLTRTQLP